MIHNKCFYYKKIRVYFIFGTIFHVSYLYRDCSLIYYISDLSYSIGCRNQIMCIFFSFNRLNNFEIIMNIMNTYILNFYQL